MSGAKLEHFSAAPWTYPMMEAAPASTSLKNLRRASKDRLDARTAGLSTASPW